MTLDKAADNLEGPRPARRDERDALLDTLDAVMRIPKGQGPTIATDYPHVYDEDNLENVMIVKDGDRVVSCCAIWVNTIEFGPSRLKAGGINCLATLPEYRHRGLASKVMEACHRRMRELGCHVGRLSTDITNWYRRLGWESAGVLCTYELNRSNISLFPVLPGDVRLRCVEHPYDDATLDTIIRLRNADRLGGIRTPELLRTLLESRGDPKVLSKPRVVLAEGRARAQAYLLDRDRGIIEWAGPGQTVAGLVRAWYEACDDPDASTSMRDENFKLAYTDQMALIAPRYDHPLVELLKSLSLPCRVDYYGMLYVIDPRGILDAFGLKDMSITQTDGRYTLERGPDKVTVDLRQLAKLLFGPERIADLASDVLPLPFWQWPIEHV